MLATHHSCGAPEFRYRGQIVCPVCTFGEGSAAGGKASEKKEGPSEPVQRRGAQEGEMPPEGVSREGAPKEVVPREGASADKVPPYTRATVLEGLSMEEDLRRAVLCKLKELADGIEREQDLDKLRKQFDCVEAALKVLRALEK